MVKRVALACVMVVAVGCGGSPRRVVPIVAQDRSSRSTPLAEFSQRTGLQVAPDLRHRGRQIGQSLPRSAQGERPSSLRCFLEQRDPDDDLAAAGRHASAL